MMNTQTQISTLSDLREAVRKDLIRVTSREATLAYLDCAEMALGDVFHTRPLVASQQTFDQWLPEEPDEGLAVVFGDERMYCRFRRSIGRLCALVGNWKSDPVSVLNWICKREGLRPLERCVFERAFPDSRPAEITREQVLEADRSLQGKDRQRLRCNIALLDRLRCLPDIEATGFLPSDPLGPLPQYRDDDRIRIDLPSRLAAAQDALAPDDARRFRRAYEIAVDLGILSAGQDMLPGGLTLETARQFHAAVLVRISRDTAGAYLRSLIRGLRILNPAAVREDVTARAVLRPEDPARNEQSLEKRDSKGKDRKPALPDFVSVELEVFAQETDASPARLKTIGTVLRRFAEARPDGADVDAIMERAEERFDPLFAETGAGTRRVYRSALRAFLDQTGRLDPWTTLRRRAAGPDAPQVSRRGLAELDRVATGFDESLTPAAINSGIASTLLDHARRTGSRAVVQRVREGLEALDQLRSVCPDLLPADPIGRLPDGRKHGNLDLPSRLETALRDHATVAGFSPAGIKSVLVAVRKLYTLSPDRAVFDAMLEHIPFVDLLAAARARAPADIAPYDAELQRLAERLATPWTVDWQRLQDAVIAGGISRAENPLEALARHAVPAGLEPWQLDREWAWAHERSLRPDLRLTWARDIERFDVLRGVDVVIDSGMLPSDPLGPMPARGARIRNAVYPLPFAIEAALEGETTAMQEAAHFLWRAARDLGLWSRGDAPAFASFLSEAVLDRVGRDQRIGSRRVAKAHLDRLRDWRRSRLAG